MYEGWLFQTLTSSQKLIGAEFFLSSNKLDKKFLLSLSLSLSLSKRKKNKQHLISSTPSYFHQKILGFREQIKPVESTCLWGVQIASKNCILTSTSPPQDKISIFFHCKQNGSIKIPPNSSTIQSLLSNSSAIHSFLPCPAKIFFSSSSSSGL